MIDIHTHILPGVDDGATSIEESIAMARGAVAQGVTTMLTTSHSAEWFRLGLLPRMVAQVETLQHIFNEEQIPLQLQPGMEIFMTPQTPADLAAGRAWTLAHSRYVLVEIPYQPWPPYTEQILFELQVVGYVPILAHPERYVALQHDPNLLYTLVERGVLAQVTGEALTGAQGSTVQRCALTLLEHGLVQFIASDTHNSTRRPPQVAAGLAVAVERIGAPDAHALLEANPQHILDNKPLVVQPRPVAPRRSFFSRLFGEQS